MTKQTKQIRSVAECEAAVQAAHTAYLAATANTAAAARADLENAEAALRVAREAERREQADRDAERDALGLAQKRLEFEAARADFEHKQAVLREAEQIEQRANDERVRKERVAKQARLEALTKSAEFTEFRRHLLPEVQGIARARAQIAAHVAKIESALHVQRAAAVDARALARELGETPTVHPIDIRHAHAMAIDANSKVAGADIPLTPWVAAVSSDDERALLIAELLTEQHTVKAVDGMTLREVATALLETGVDIGVLRSASAGKATPVGFRMPWNQSPQSAA